MIIARALTSMCDAAADAALTLDATPCGNQA
jgi:hypothetical protein